MGFQVELRFYGNLPGFLPRDRQSNPVVFRKLWEKTGVKDVIEACGIPHPEVDLIIARTMGVGEGQAVEFAWQILSPTVLDVYPVPAPVDLFPKAPRLQVPIFRRFVADGHLGKLARNLRLLGIDTAYERDADDARLLEIMAQEDRALLTRDRRLLMHSVVRHGYCPRSQDPFLQTQEVLDRFQLRGDPATIAPYRRCLRCNGLLQAASKEEIAPDLSNEPLTLRYYDDFQRCAACGRIYWKGTHFDRLAQRVNKLSN